MDWLSDPETWIALLTLTTLEVVLGIDNIVFISILSSKLPAHQQARGRQVGLALAMVTRILLLLSISWVIGLTEPWFSIVGKEFSGRDLILIGVAYSSWERPLSRYTRSWRARRPMVPMWPWLDLHP